jgi:hypothetical protein
MMRRSAGVRLVHVAMLFVFASLLFALFPSTASAIPAWSRRYDVPCSTCHYPAPPRLNAYGQKFRRAQFRLPEEFNKDADWKNLKNYVAMRIRGRYEYDSNEGAGTVTSSFKLNDATLFYAGPVAKNFSGFVELERPGDEEIIEAVVAIGGIRGKPDSFWTFRLGQFHTLTRVGFGGLDRPTGISTPSAVSRALVSGNGFALNQDQVGMEGTYVHKNWRVIGQVLNGSNSLTNTNPGKTTDQADENMAKDAVLAYELMWGQTASGLTAFGYRGIQDDLNSTAAPNIVTMKRIGVTAAQVFKNGFEVQGGYVKATDDYDVPVTTVDSVKGSGYWVEVEQYFNKMKDLTLLGRYDFTDPNTDVSDNSRKQLTVGLVLPVADWHARWAVELQSVTQQSGTGDQKDKKAVAELMFNF